MSYTETHKGLLVKFPRLEDEQDKEYLKRCILSTEQPFIEDTFEDDIEEYLSNTDMGMDILYLKGSLYFNKNHANIGEEDISIFTPMEHGIGYLVQFYNGGTYLNEVLEEGIADE